MDVKRFPPFEKSYSRDEIRKLIEKIRREINRGSFETVVKSLTGFIDLTSLNTGDTEGKITEMTNKVNRFKDNFPESPNMAAICVFPVFVPVVRKTLVCKDVKIASVAGSFPSSQTFLEIKKREVEMAVEAGATEIDIVLNAGKFLVEDVVSVEEEIKLLKKSAGSAGLKVILETGLLPDHKSVRIAALLAMQAGADFIKTSTGKLSPAATPDKFFVMLDAIKDFYEATGRKPGIKAAGGIATPEDALLYYKLTESVLGPDWLNPEGFRIGASRLANNLLSVSSGQGKPVAYF